MSHILEFLDLVDVPDTYAGSGGYRLRVDSTPDAIEFVADTFTNLSDTPADFSGFPDYYLKVNTGATAVEFQSAANLETALGGPFLPLTAGVGEPLSGDLYIETASSPKLTLTYTSVGSMTIDTATLGIQTNAGAGGTAELVIHGATGLTYTDNTDTDYAVWTEKDFDYADYLPLAGGTVVGDVYFEANIIFEVGKGIYADDYNHRLIDHLALSTVVQVGDNLGWDVQLLGLNRPAWNDGGGAVELAIVNDLGDYLPLAAGSGSPLTDALHIDSTSAYPGLFIDDDTNDVQAELAIDTTASGLARLEVNTPTAQSAYLHLRGNPSDLTKNAELMFNWGLGAVNNARCRFYGPDSLELFRIEGGGDVRVYVGDLHLAAGNLTTENGGAVYNTAPSDTVPTLLPNTADPNTGIGSAGADKVNLIAGGVNVAQAGAAGLAVRDGDLFVEDATYPTLFLREGGSSTDYTYLVDSGANGSLGKQSVTGPAVMRIDPLPDDNAGDATLDLFRSTDTSGDVVFNMYIGDNTATIQHSFDAGGGNVSLCQQGGNLSVDGEIIVDYGYSLQVKVGAGEDIKDAITGGSFGITFGDVSVPTYLVGSATRPTYNGADLALLSDTGAGTYLPLTAGSGEALTGNLYIDNASNPTIFLREGGDTANYSRIINVQDNLMSIQHVTAAADSYLRIDPMVTDETSAAYVQMFRDTTTTGLASFKMYEGDGSSVIHHEFYTGDSGNINFCKEGGTFTVVDANLYMDKASDPSIFLSEGGDANNYLRLWQTNITTGKLQQYTNAATSYMDIDSIPTDGTSHGYIRMFRTANTTGNSTGLYIYEAANTANIQHSFNAKTGDVHFGIQSGITGDVYADTGNFYCDATTNPAIYLREGGSATDYARLMDAGTTSTWSKFAATGGAVCSIRPTPSNGTSVAGVDMFRTTSTSGTKTFTLYEGSAGDATVSAQVDVGTGSWRVCKNGGNFTVDSGNLYLDKTASPTIYLREAASTTSYMYMVDEATTLGSIYKRTLSGNTTLRIDPLAIDGTSSATVQLFRTTNTTGAKNVYIHKGDGTSDVQHHFNGTGNATLCRYAGGLGIGASTTPTETLMVTGDASVSEGMTVSITVSNDSGSSMSAGNLCYISGDSSGVPQVTLADADAEATASKMLVVIAETIATGSDGRAIVRGFVTGLSALTAGNILYVGLTAGVITHAAPSGSGDIVRIVGHALTTTSMFFNPDNAWVEVA